MIAIRSALKLTLGGSEGVITYAVSGHISLSTGRCLPNALQLTKPPVNAYIQGS